MISRMFPPLALAVALQTACLGQTVIYSSGFSAPVGPEWSVGTRSVTPNGRAFLGEFTNQTVNLTFTNLTTHTNVVVSFDLFIIASWDGSNTNNPGGGVVGPDIWDLRVADGPVLLHTTFSNNEDEPVKRQAYPDNFPGGEHLPRTGAAETRTLGYPARADSVYRLSFTIPHSANSVRLDFSATGLEERLNESWGLDNVEVAMGGIPAQAPPQITRQPASSTVMAGEAAELVVDAVPNFGLKYQWFRGTQELPGQTARLLQWSAVSNEDAGEYTARVSNDFGEVFSQTASLTVVTGPANQVVAEGQTVTLSVAVAGLAPLAFQWGVNGVDLPGATNADLVLPGISLDKTANYFVRVVAPNRVLSLPPPKVTVLPFGFQPVYAEGFQGAVGPEWSRRIRSTTPEGRRRFLGRMGNETVTLTLTNFQPHTTASVSFDLFLMRSWDGDDPVSGPDAFQMEVEGQGLLLDGTFRLVDNNDNFRQSYPGRRGLDRLLARTGAAENNTLGEAWFGDAVYLVNVQFAHTSDDCTLSFLGSGLEPLDNESWGLDNVVISTANVPPNSAPIITMLPRSQVVCTAVPSWEQPGTAVFTVGATPSLGLSYAWKRDGSVLADATTAYLVISNVTATHAGSYTVEVKNLNGSTTRAPALLGVVTSIPFGQTVNAGGTATFGVEAAGPGLRYQWRRNGIDLAGKTGLILTLPNVTRDDAGDYAVLVENGGTPWVSTPATLTVPSGGFPGGLIWAFAADSPVYSSPAIASDGTLYFSSYAGWLYAVASDGALKWKRRLGDAAVASPGLGPDGTIYACHNAAVYSLSPSGDTNWIASLSGGFIYSGPAVTADGEHLYVSGGINAGTKLVCLNRNGQITWEFEAGGRVYGSPALGADGTVYFGTLDNGVLYAVRPDGTMKWQHTLGTEWIYGSPAVGADGTVYYARAAGTSQVVALSPAGEVKEVWHPGSAICSPSLGRDEVVYVTTHAGVVRALAPGGRSVWSYVAAAGQNFSTAPALSASGTLYVWTANGTLVALNPNGTRRWEVVTSGEFTYHVRPSPVVGPDGTVYIGAADGHLYAIRGDTGPADSPWPMFGHDARHTSRAPIQVVPQSMSVSLGANPTFTTVSSEVAPTTYQWLHEGTPIPNATNATLTVSNTRTGDAGNYAVVLDQFGTKTTYSGFTLAVDPTFTKITAGPLVTNIADTVGAAWTDYDGDGHTDVFLAEAYSRVSRLYRNNGNGTFSENASGTVTNENSAVIGAAWSDYDNDGWPDLMTADYEGHSSAVYRNQGNGRFLPLAPSGLANDGARFAYDPAWADYDGDGFLDLFVAGGGGNGRNLLYRNLVGSGFVRVSQGNIATDGMEGTYSLCAVWGDYNMDGWQDLFVGNQGRNNDVYRNNQDGTFTKLTAGVIVTDGPVVTQGAAWVDFDNDGLLDLFLANDRTANRLYRNLDGVNFRREETRAGLATVANSIGCSWGDYDNDGFIDLFVATSGDQNNSLFHNDGDGTFTPIATGSIVNEGGNSWGATWVDYDNDGFLDMFVANRWQPNFLYRNSGNGNHWLRLHLIGTRSNNSAIGAKVRVRSGPPEALGWQLREISDGSGHGMSPLDAHFGLGQAMNAVVLRIEWPSGIVQEFENVAADRFVTIYEPPVLEVGLRQPDRSFEIILTSRGGFDYAIEASNDLTNWSRIGTLNNVNGSVQFVDQAARQFNYRFYRALMIE